MKNDKDLKIVTIRGKSIAKVLSENPNTVVVNHNDEGCKAFLASMGMLDLFEKCEGPHWSVVGSDDHKTHYVIAFRFANNPSPRDDGFLVYLVPKDGALRSLEDAVDFFVALKGGYDGRCPAFFDSKARVKKN